MKIKIANKILSLALATSMVLTSFVPSYAMEEPVDEQTPIEFLDENEEEEEESAAAASSSVEVKEETPVTIVAGDGEDDPDKGDGTDGNQLSGDDDILILDEEEKEEESKDAQKTPSVISISYELGEDAELAESDKEKTSLEGYVGEEMTITLAEPVCDDQIFDGWYTTSDYTDADFTYVEDTNTWTYTFTPEEEEVSLTFYASFGLGSKLMGTDPLTTELKLGDKLSFRVDPGEYGRFFLLEGSADDSDAIKENQGSFEYDTFGQEIVYYYRPITLTGSWSSHCHYIIPDAGYELEGIYTDSNYSQKLDLPRTQYDRDYGVTADYNFHYSELPEAFRTQLEAGAQPTLYLKWEPIELRIVCNEEFVGDTTLHNGDTFPDFGDYYRPGFTFDGWYYTDGTGNSTQIVAGQTKLSLGQNKKGWPNYHYSSDNDCYFIDIYAKQTLKKYTVNYHINNYNGDIKVSKAYTVRNGATPLDITKGDVSGNSSFDKNNDVFLGWTTKEGEFFACDDVNQPTVMDIIEYADENGLTTIDLYGQWDDTNHTYTVVFDAGVNNATEEDFEPLVGDFAKSDFAYSVTVDEEGRAQHSELVSKGETVLLSGEEYVREGYTLTGWTYKKNNRTYNIKPTASFKDLASGGETITLTATWKTNTYTLTYNLNGGKMVGKDAKGKALPTKVTYTAESAQDKMPFYNYSETGSIAADTDWVITKPGYKFTGWNTDLTYYGDDVLQNMTLTAQWEPIKYTIRINGGETEETSGLYHGQTWTSSPLISYGDTISLKGLTFVRNGYKFKNYKATVNGKSVTYSATSSLKNLTTVDGETVVLTAQWTPVTYTVTYALNGGALPKRVKNATKYVSETGIATISSPVKNGYDFAGWALTQKGVEAGNETATIDNTLDEEEVCTKASIAGNDANYGNVILTAQWTPKEYGFKFVDVKNDHTYEDIDGYTGLTFADSINFNEAAKAIDGEDKELSLKGFSTEADYKKNKVTYNLTSSYAPSKFSYDGDNAATLYAMWGNAKTYHISYTGIEGLKLSKAILTYSWKEKTEQTLPTVSKKGYTFGGWTVTEGTASLTADGKKIAKDQKGDIVLEPVFTPIEYKVLYSPNAKDVKLIDGVTAVPNKKVQLGTVKYDNDNGLFDTLPDENEWVRTGYTFKGFATSARSTTPIESLENLTTGKSITLYAIWQANPYTVTYLNNAEVIDSTKGIIFDIPDNIVNITYGKAYKVNKKLTANGYTFMGWKLYSPTQSNAVTLSKGYVTGVKATNASDVILKPVFAEFTYKIVFNPNGGKYEGSSKALTFSGNKGSDDVSGLLTPLVNAKRPGYILRCIAYDKAGKKPVVFADGSVHYNTIIDGTTYALRALTTKNNGSVTLYAVWDKVASIKPEAVNAILDSENSILQVGVNAEPSDDTAYEVEYSNNLLFTGLVEKAIIDYNENNITINDLASQYKSKCYVRVRKIMEDSTGEEIECAWGKTVRASKAVSND